MSDIGEDEMDIGSNAGSQHEEEDFEDIIGTQIQESYQGQEDTDLQPVFNPNAADTEPTPEPVGTLESSEPVTGDSDPVMLDHGIPSKQKANTSTSPATHLQLQNLQLKAPKGSASPPSVAPGTHTSEGPSPRQRSNDNIIRRKRTPKAIPADAYIIDLDSFDIASPKARIYESSPGIKKEHECIEIAQQDFSPRIKQEANDNDRWIWCTSRDEPMVILDDDEETPGQVTSGPVSGSYTSPMSGQPNPADGESGLPAGGIRSFDSDSGTFGKGDNLNAAKDILQEADVERGNVDVPMPDQEVVDATTNTEGTGKDQANRILKLGNSILGKPTKPLDSREERKKALLEATKLWAAQGMRKGSVGGASTIFNKPVLAQNGSDKVIAGSSQDNSLDANGAFLDSDEWMNVTLEDDRDAGAKFAAIKKKYQARKRARKNTFTDDIEFIKAQTAESNRLKRLQDELEQSKQAGPGTETPPHDMDDEGDDLFLPQPHRTSSSYRAPYVESDDSAAEPELAEADANEDR
ncbi:MAG: hypothetical protein M1835_003195 [Candelina submexicana]|nr:MAG: hypothetical protein M1835_003195 [Candelina submexicana]